MSRARVRRGTKTRLLQAAGFTKAWLGRMIMLCRGRCSHEINKELTDIYERLNRVIEIIEKAEVV